MIFNIGGYANPDSLLPSFSYNGDYNLVDEGKNGSIRNWNLTFSGGGVFVPNRDMIVDIFVIGAGGAGNKDGRGGGGGYYTTANKITLKKGTSYTLGIGAGGSTNGAAGGNSSAFGYTANGGSGGVAGTPKYIQCTMSQSLGSGVYVYGGNNVSGYDSILPSGSSVQLACDSNGGFVYETIMISGQEAGAYKGYDGKYYRGMVDAGSYYTVYSSGSTGAGGSSTTVLHTGTTVGGAGADSGATNASRRGQGGAGNGAYGGSAFGTGGNGLIVIRNVR